MLEHALFVVDILALVLAQAGQGGHFGDQPMKNGGVGQQLDESPHILRRHPAPFGHEFVRRHIVRDAARGLDDGHPSAGLHGQVVVGRHAQSANAKQVIAA